MDSSTSSPLLDQNDLNDLPDDNYRHELVAGLLLSEPLPAHGHDRVRRRVERVLESFVEPRKLGEVFGEAGYLLARDPDTVRGPDVSFVIASRLVDFDDTSFFPGAPDLAIEILSPSNRPAEMYAKVADYLAAGARLVWVLDPVCCGVTEYRKLLAPRRLGPSDTLDGGDVLPGFTIEVRALFHE